MNTAERAPLPLDAPARQTAEATFIGLGAEGFRVLAVAWRDVESDQQRISIADERELTFAGFLAFLDPPKPDARKALAALANLGITMKVVTGDNEQVTRHVCGELGLDVRGTLTGPQIDKLTDEALMARVDETTLFCRVTPPQKSRIIATLRRIGHVVGYIGDGINDAPPLHAADVGFSVDTAVDVAKEAAAMILLRKDLAVLAEGVREGRRTFANILKYMMMGTSSNFGNMFSMAGGVLFLPFLPMLPAQILLNNLLYDLSETAIPLDTVAESTIARPRRWDLGTLRQFMLVFGPISSVFDFLTFFLLLSVFHADEALFHTGWFIESAVHAGFGHLHHPHGASVARPTASGPDCELTHRRRRGRAAAVFAGSSLAGLRPASTGAARSACDPHRRLSGGGAACEALVLHALSLGLAATMIHSSGLMALTGSGGHTSPEGDAWSRGNLRAATSTKHSDAGSE